MIHRRLPPSMRQLQQSFRNLRSSRTPLACPFAQSTSILPQRSKRRPHPHPHLQQQYITPRFFSTSASSRAQPPTADALMTNLTDLYSTAKDEFEIAAEETEKKTVYAAEDREAAKEALATLKEAYEKAVRESDPETAREVQSRTGPRIKELENALVAVEEMAMED